MPIKKSDLKTKTGTFFYDMVTVEAICYKSAGIMAQKEAMRDQFNQISGQETVLNNLLAYAIAQTVSMEFDWDPETPEHYRALEDAWTMINSTDTPLEETYEFITFKMDESMLDAWQRAIFSLQEIWKPDRERGISKPGDDEDSPNS